MPETTIPVSPASLAWLQPFASRNLRTSLPTPLIIPPYRGASNGDIIKHGFPEMKTSQDVVWGGAYSVEKTLDIEVATRPARPDPPRGPGRVCGSWSCADSLPRLAPSARCGPDESRPSRPAPRGAGNAALSDSLASRH